MAPRFRGRSEPNTAIFFRAVRVGLVESLFRLKDVTHYDFEKWKPVYIPSSVGVLEKKRGSAK